MRSRGEILEILEKILRPASKVKDVDAAVALLMRDVSKDFEVLLVKRSVQPSDPWSGQVAFPGGKHDTEDIDMKHTVVREVFEETGINLNSHCRFLGALRKFRSVIQPKLLVVPFVVFLEKIPILTLSRELEGFCWIQLEKLRQNRITSSSLHAGRLPAYLVEDHLIWGLTYRILEEFTEVFEKAKSVA